MAKLIPIILYISLLTSSNYAFSQDAEQGKGEDVIDEKIVDEKMVKEFNTKIDPLIAKCTSAAKLVKDALRGIQSAAKTGNMKAVKKHNENLDRFAVPYATAYSNAYNVLEEYEKKGLDVSSKREKIEKNCSSDL